jgi:NADH:ubiquinone oxidoreductase subunit E
MTKKETSEKALNIIKEYKTKSNKDLIFVMDIIQKDFNVTKETLLKLTHHIDKLESTYDLILKEFESRTKYAQKD